jgi:signal peptidase II
VELTSREHGRVRADSARVFWPVLLAVILADVVTKYVAHTRLVPPHVARDLLGDTLRLTLTYNPGAAFGLNVGAYSRWIFLLLTAAALVILGRLYRDTSPHDRWRALALGLVCGGAMGNLINRLWSARGVVDFIDFGLGRWRWPTFNIADIGVSVGALLLAWVLWDEERRLESDRHREPSPRESEAG